MIPVWMAKEIVEERKRRGQRSELFDCLQFSDKGKIVLNTRARLDATGLRSKNAARQGKLMEFAAALPRTSQDQGRADDGDDGELEGRL